MFTHSDETFRNKIISLSDEIESNKERRKICLTEIFLHSRGSLNNKRIETKTIVSSLLKSNKGIHELLNKTDVDMDEIFIKNVRFLLSIDDDTSSLLYEINNKINNEHGRGLDPFYFKKKFSFDQYCILPLIASSNELACITMVSAIQKSNKLTDSRILSELVYHRNLLYYYGFYYFLYSSELNQYTMEDKMIMIFLSLMIQPHSSNKLDKSNSFNDLLESITFLTKHCTRMTVGDIKFFKQLVMEWTNVKNENLSRDLYTAMSRCLSGASIEKEKLTLKSMVKNKMGSNRHYGSYELLIEFMKSGIWIDVPYNWTTNDKNIIKETIHVFKIFKTHIHEWMIENVNNKNSCVSLRKKKMGNECYGNIITDVIPEDTIKIETGISGKTESNIGSKIHSGAKTSKLKDTDKHEGKKIMNIFPSNICIIIYNMQQEFKIFI